MGWGGEVGTRVRKESWEPPSGQAGGGGEAEGNAGREDTRGRGGGRFQNLDLGSRVSGGAPGRRVAGSRSPHPGPRRQRCVCGSVCARSRAKGDGGGAAGAGDVETGGHCSGHSGGPWAPPCPRPLLRAAWGRSPSWEDGAETATWRWASLLRVGGSGSVGTWLSPELVPPSTPGWGRWGMNRGPEKASAGACHVSSLAQGGGGPLFSPGTPRGSGPHLHFCAGKRRRISSATSSPNPPPPP